jgi:putative sugar O-methyltransferase
LLSVKNLFLFLIIYLLFASCGKKEKKHSPQCLYDHRVFAEAIFNSVRDETQFAVFKRNPYFNLLWENHTFEEGREWLKSITEKYPLLKEKLESFRQIDQLGSPRVYDFGANGFFSPSTLRLIAKAGDLDEKLGNLDGADVVQIGADFGSWCKILNDLYQFKSYTIVDLPEPLSLAKKCLEKMGITHVRFLTPEELPKKKNYTLCLSDKCFSEFDKSHQKLFFERVMRYSSCGYLIACEFPKHYGVVGMTLDQLTEKFEKRGKQSKVDEFSNYYCVYWREGTKP